MNQIKELTLLHFNQGKPFTIHYEIDRFIKEVLIDGEYKPLVDKSKLGNDLVMMDLGCNIGTFSLSIYDRCKQIYAIDLSEPCIKLLNQTIEDNKLNKIKTFCQAIGGANEEVKVTSLDNTDGSNQLYLGEYKINTITLSTFFKQQNIDHIDLLKMDVESAEDGILRVQDFLDIKDKIHVIIGEDHRADLNALFDKLGYDYSLEHGRHFIAINKTYGNDRPSNKEL